MDKPFAITLDVGTSRANKTGSWRTERAVYTNRMPPCNDACPAGENVQAWLYEAEEGGEGDDGVEDGEAAVEPFEFGVGGAEEGAGERFLTVEESVDEGADGLEADVRGESEERERHEPQCHSLT